MLKRYLVFFISWLSVSGCGYLSDTYLVCDGDEEIREGSSKIERFVRAASVTLKKNYLGRPESISVESKTWSTYKGIFLYTSQSGYYVFREGDPNGDETSITFKPENGKMILIRRQGGQMVFAANYVCRKADVIN